MQLESMETIFYTCIFLVPGYIIEELMRVVMPAKQNSEGIKLIRYLIYSIVNLAIWSWVYWLLITYLKSNALVYWILLVAITLCSAIITGFAMGLVRKQNIIRNIFSRFKIQIEHPVPTAWDYKFSEITDYNWLIIKLANGECVYGKYGCKSLASSDENYRDIYLEEIYTWEEGEDWKKVDGTEGVWINAEEIKSIEFRK